MPEFLDTLKQDDELPLTRVELSDGWTQPPCELREAELIEAMDKNGIGTGEPSITHADVNALTSL